MTAKTTTRTGPRDIHQAAPGAADGPEPQAHTELRAAGSQPRPRSKVLPPEVQDGDDDLFNDLPV